MWQDLIPVLFDRFNILRQSRAVHPAVLVEEALCSYESFCLEMLDGIRTLLLSMIENQAYVRKKYPNMALRMYLEIHVDIMQHVAYCGSAAIQDMPTFYYELLRLVELLRGYCVVLKQDVLEAYARYPKLQKDRRFRQINLLARQTIDAIRRLKAKTVVTSKSLSADTASQALQAVSAPNFGEWELLMKSAGFSEVQRMRLLVENDHRHGFGG